MGGDREAYLEGKGTPAPSPDVSGTVAGVGGDRIRIHQAGGEVHFHDDAHQLKAAVPVALWWSAWETLSKAGEMQTEEWSFADVVNNTLLKVTTQMNSDDTPKKLEAIISLEKVETGTNFRALQQFTKRR